MSNRNADNIFSRTLTSIVFYKNFRLVWIGSWAEHLGEWAEITALLWLINQMTDSPFMGALMITLRYLPMVVFAFVGGIVADRINRRNLLIYSLAAAALISVAIAVLLQTGLLQIWHLLVYSVLIGIATSFNHPARNTLVANLIKREHYLNAITLDNASVMTSRILGAPLGGFILGLAGTVPVLGLRVLGLLVAMLLLRNVQAPPRQSEAKDESPLSNFTEGIRYVAGNKPVLTQVLLYLLPFFVTSAYTGLLPNFATNVLHIGPDLYGVLNSAPGIGSLVATVILASLISFRHKSLLLVVSGVLQGLALGIFLFSPVYLVSVLLLVIVGGANALFMSLNNTIIQEMVSDKLRGRVMALREVVYGLGPAGNLITGSIAAVLGVSVALGIAGAAAIAVLFVILLAIPRPPHQAKDS
jgi:MFS family permease